MLTICQQISQMENDCDIVDVVVIGSGISGLAASWQLSKSGINHIIVESRNRIGGRITSKTFQGTVVHLGASFIHNPDEKNRIAQLMKEWNWKTIPAAYESMQYFLWGSGQAELKKVQEAQLILDDMQESIKKAAQLAENDISLEQAAQDFLKEICNKDQQVQSLLKWYLNIFGNIEGAEISQISAKQFENDEQADDCLPADGYLQILQKIYGFYKPIVEFNKRVTKIDYTNDHICVYAGNKVYQAKRVISSLPLGILKKQLVQFCPPLPENQRRAINKIGNGIANKIIVRFEQAFWDTSKQWVNFVTKEQNKYPVAFTMAEQQKFILCFFISGDASKQMSEHTDDEIKEDLLKFLRGFGFKEAVEIKAIEVTRWHKDPDSLGSYSYFPVGTTVADVETLRSPINQKLWFIGEHCHPIMNACAHAAFETGIWAAEEVVASLAQK